MKSIFTLFLSLFITAAAFAQFPTIYATVNSGGWATTSIWETFTGNATNTPGAQGTGTAAAGIPSGTHYVYVRAGHTVALGTSNRSCIGMTIEATGKVWANDGTNQRRLQIATGGTGFTTAQNYSLVNNGTFGGATDGIYIEPGTYAGVATIGGTGVYQLARIRIPGALVNNPTLVVDQNLDLTQTANYGIAAFINATPSDNNTITINAGKTVTLAATGYLHQNAVGSTGTGFGTYTYNINGTLDNSANLGTSGITLFQPLAAGSTVNVNVNGIYKVGSFSTSDNSGSAGTVNLVIKNGGIVDNTSGGTWTINPTVTWKIEGTGKLIRTVAASDVLFPVGVGTSYNPATLNNAGASDVFSVNVSNTVSNTGAIIDPTKIVNKQWTIAETVAGGSNATLKLGWVTADQAAGFNSSNPVVIGRWNGTAWAYYNATISGTGTVADPYIASAPGITADFTSSNPFIVANKSALPVTIFGAKAYAKESAARIEWSVGTEENVASYIIERAINSKDFAPVTTVEAKSVSSYTATDASPVPGVNYYRIKVLDKDGSFKYSSILPVNISKTKAEVVIAPNPVKGGQMNLQIGGLEKGIYSLRLYNDLGQEVFNTQISTTGGSISQSFILPSTVNAGIYNLQLSGGDAKISKRVIVQ